jgi:phosphate transport system substrate-binding protein
MAQKNETLTLILAFLVTAAILGGGYWWFTRYGNLNLTKISPDNQSNNQPSPSPPPTPTPPSPNAAPPLNPSPSPTELEPVPNFPFPETVARGTTITIDGSTSMAQINQALKNAFEQQFSGTIVNINAKGSEHGLRELLAGKIDLAASSRPLTPQEEEQGLVATPVTQDAIAIVVGINNAFRRGLREDQVVDIFAGRIANWSQLGGENAPIRVINRPPVSGTRKIFQELVLKGDNFGDKPNFTTMQRDATTPILSALATDGISYATYSQVANQRTVRTVAIDGLIPEAPNYPYKRTLYYIYKQPATSAVQAFLGYVTSTQGERVIKSVELN